MKKIDITITDKQYYVLKDIAGRENVSLSDAVMKCIEFFKNYKPMTLDQYRRILSMAGKYDSGLGDLAKKHDKHINEDICEI